MLIPELGDIPERLGHISLALLPANGLHIRPANNMQVVMNAQEAAELTAILKPELAIGGAGSLVQLNEIPIPDGDPADVSVGP
jgi:hypothetical protein